MKKIFYLFGALIIIWLVFIIVGFFSNKKENLSEIPNTKYQIQNTLILFYNKDLISAAPANWQEFMDIKNAAMGTADNVEYAPEILVLLMLQQGVVWPDFDNELGQLATKFYTQFADSSKKVYTWNEKRENSLIEFSQGRINMVFAFENDKEKFSNINYGISRIPVIDISQEAPQLPELSESEKAVLAEMIESVASGRKSVEEAIKIGAEQIKDLND